MLTKSQLWSEVKQLGNPLKLKWTSSASAMKDSIQSIYLQNELNTFMDFEFRPERIPSTQIEQYFTPELFLENDLTVDNTVFKIPEANRDIARQIQDAFESREVGDIVKINGVSFTVTDNVAKNVQEVFEALYPDELELALEFYNEEVEKQDNNQVYRLGDVNCLINPIKLQIQSSIDNSTSRATISDLRAIMNKLIRLEPLFEQQGATPELIKRLADATQSRISIYEVVSQKEIEYAADKVKRRFHFKFQNISMNHVQLWSGKNETQVIENIDEKYEELANRNQTFKYQIVNKCIVKIDCGTDTFVDVDYMRLKGAEDEINDQTRDLQISIKTRVLNQYTGDVPNSQIPFLQQAIQVGGCMKLKDVKDSSKLKHIDMITGYAQFQYLPEEYRFGVPYMTEFRKVTSVDFAIKHNGIYECTITQLPESIKAVLGVRQKYMLYSNVIKFLNDRNVKISIIGGMYGKHSKHITLSESAYEKHCGRKAYYTAFSKYGIVSDQFDQKIHCGDRYLAGIIREALGYRMVSLDEDNYNMTIIKKQKPNIKTRSHVYTYILQCQQMNLMMQLEKMDMNKIALLVGDDIYYEDHDFEQLPTFRPKGENKFDLLKDFADSTYLRIPHESRQSFEYGKQEDVYNQYELHQGAGGFGKTHTRLSDIGSIGLVYTTLTNQLVDEQKKSKFQAKAYTSAKIVQKIAERKLCCSNLVIDECSLVGINALEYLKTQLPHSRIYVLGDDLQISDGDKEIFNPQHYDKVVTEEHYQTDYRAARCPELQALKQSIRKAMRSGKNEMEIYTEIIKPASQQTTCKEFIQNYNSQKMIAVCSNKQKDAVTEGLKNHIKYRVNECFIRDGKKYNTGQILYELPEGFDYEKDQKNKRPRLTLQHGYTCHSLQGMTHNNEILITKPISLEIFRGFCYTAVSRLTTIKHLFSI